MAQLANSDVLRRTIRDVAYDGLGNRFVPEDQIDYPGSDGCSFVLGALATTEDCLEIMGCPDCGVAVTTCGHIRSLKHTIRVPDQNGNESDTEFRLDPVHRPEPGSERFPENYAHCVVRTLRGDDEINYKVVRKKQKRWHRELCEHFRSKLATELTIERHPDRGDAA